MTERLGSPALNQTRFEPRKRHQSSSGSLGLTKECKLHLGSEQATSETMVTSHPEATRGQFRTALDMADISNWSRAAHDTVRHAEREYARGLVHANSAEGINDRVRRTVAGVFHHVSPRHADLYFNEIGFRGSPRVLAGRAVRRTRKRHEIVKPLWSRITPALKLPTVFKSAVGRQLRRTGRGGVHIRCAVSVFG